MNQFKAVSIILPLMNETNSFMKTIEIILAECGGSVLELIVVVCQKTTPESLALAGEFKQKLGERVQILNQTLPFLGGAVRNGFEAAKGSHVLMMATDLETPPENAKDLIALAQKNSEAIVTGSRWAKGGNFEGYSPVKYLFNFVFQKFFSILYGTRLTDMTYGYRIFPASLVKSIQWEELRHAFLFETLVKPLRLGIPVIEIPVIWRRRSEGVSQNTFLQNFIYFRTGIKTLFLNKNSILKTGA